MSRFYSHVPKDLEANLRYRFDLRQRAEDDSQFQQALLTACKHDVLFFFNAFCYLFEPRDRFLPDGRKKSKIIPFITWPHQDPAILEIKNHLGREDIGINKSRGEGASWIAILLAVHDWLFVPMTAIGLVSRNEDAVDKTNDPDSLMWKIDWELDRLPAWMVPAKVRNRGDHTLLNMENSATIAGYAATGDVASGGRKTWFLMDELAKFPRGPDSEAMASTQHVTDSRLIPSTPKGADGEYYRIMHEPGALVKVKLHWSDNPSKNRGLYRLEEDKDGRRTLVVVDPVNNPLPEGYADQMKAVHAELESKGFRIVNRPRSPWYDHECNRGGATPNSIAQELDMDFGGSMHRIFGTDFFKSAEKGVRKPAVRGVLSYHPETCEVAFDKSDDGPVFLWCPLDNKRRPPVHNYVIGVDVSSGLGGGFTSNSCIQVVDTVTMEQVLEYAVNTIEPAQWADLAIGIAKWFHDAYLAWEINGPGRGFTKRVLQRGYGNIYYRTNQFVRGKKKTREVGFNTSKDTKEAMFMDMQTFIREERVQVHSAKLVEEFGQYVRLADKIEHILARNTDDESAQGAAHGDRVMAFGVCLQAVQDRPVGAQVLTDTLAENPPPGTMAYRQKEHEDALVDKSDGWDGRTNWDLSVGKHGIKAA